MMFRLEFFVGFEFAFFDGIGSIVMGKDYKMHPYSRLWLFSYVHFYNCSRFRYKYHPEPHLNWKFLKSFSVTCYLNNNTSVR